jgi:hypothetical protein
MSSGFHAILFEPETIPSNFRRQRCPAQINHTTQKTSRHLMADHYKETVDPFRIRFFGFYGCFGASCKANLVPHYSRPQICTLNCLRSLVEVMSQTQSHVSFAGVFSGSSPPLLHEKTFRFYHLASLLVVKGGELTCRLDSITIKYLTYLGITI